jgi:hypothetical protein
MPSSTCGPAPAAPSPYAVTQPSFTVAETVGRFFAEGAPSPFGRFPAAVSSRSPTSVQFARPSGVRWRVTTGCSQRTVADRSPKTAPHTGTCASTRSTATSGGPVKPSGLCTSTSRASMPLHQRAVSPPIVTRRPTDFDTRSATQRRTGATDSA